MQNAALYKEDDPFDKIALHIAYEAINEMKSKYGDLKNNKVLIVEDSSIQVELYKIAFERYKSDFLYAPNGLEAIKIITEEPDLSIIISDFNMPLMNGIELLETINEKKLTNCPFIIMSTGENIINLEKAVELGAVCYLIKPWNMDHIRDILDELEN